MGNPTVLMSGPASLFNNDPTQPGTSSNDIMPNPAGGSASGFGHPTCFKQTTDPRPVCLRFSIEPVR